MKLWLFLVIFLFFLCFFFLLFSSISGPHLNQPYSRSSRFINVDSEIFGTMEENLGNKEVLENCSSEFAFC